MTSPAARRTPVGRLLAASRISVLTREEQEAKKLADAATRKATSARTTYLRAARTSKVAKKKATTAAATAATAKRRLAAAVRKGRGVGAAKRAYALAKKRSATARTAAAKAATAASAARSTYLSAQREATAAQTRHEAAAQRLQAEKDRVASGDPGGSGDSGDQADPDVALVVSRFTGGYTAAQVADVVAAGGPLPWLEKQLSPTPTDHATVTQLETWFPDLLHTPQQRFDSERSGGAGSWEYAAALGNATLLRRIHSTWQVHEVLTEFWSDHLHIPATADGWYWRQDYDRTIRKHALGRFTDLLVAATLHPAMLQFLGNFSSRAGAVNENHARELLELHTLGVGHHTEADVKATGRILSGWTVDPWASPRTFHAHYDDRRHAKTAATVAGFSTDGNGRDGQTARDFLLHLARHPDTARRLMRKVAVRLVSDDPSVDLVATLTTAYLDNDTAIGPVLLTLVRHPEFLASAHRKVRTEEAGFVATMRALGVTVARPTRDTDAAHHLVYAYGAAMPYLWPRPDGRPDHAAAYSDPGRILRSFGMHSALLGGWWPKGNIDYPTPASRLPDMSTHPRLADVVQHVHRDLTGRDAEPALVTAAAEAVGLPASTVLSPAVWQAEALRSWLGVRLMSPILDNPAHLTC